MAKRQKPSSSTGIIRHGDLLVEQFRSAMMTLATVLHARHSAKESERTALESLATLPTNNPLYVTPNDIPAEREHELTRNSLDAHLQKVQSEQLASQAENFLQQLEAETKTYIGKKLRVNVTAAQLEPVEAYWRDPNTGVYNASVYRPRRFRGVVHEVRLRENALILKPTYVTRLMSSRLGYYAVYIIDPETLTPMVSLSLY